MIIKPHDDIKIYTHDLHELSIKVLNSNLYT